MTRLEEHLAQHDPSRITAARRLMEIMDRYRSQVLAARRSEDRDKLQKLTAAFKREIDPILMRNRPRPFTRQRAVMLGEREAIREMVMKWHEIPGDPASREERIGWFMELAEGLGDGICDRAMYEYQDLKHGRIRRLADPERPYILPKDAIHSWNQGRRSRARRPSQPERERAR